MTFIDIIRESKTVLDSRWNHVPGAGFRSICHISNFHLDSNCQQDSGFLELNPRIPDFTSKTFPDSGFHRPKIPGFWNPSYLTLGEIMQDEITGSCLCHQQCRKLESAVESDRASVSRLACF